MWRAGRAATISSRAFSAAAASAAAFSSASFFFSASCSAFSTSIAAAPPLDSWRAIRFFFLPEVESTAAPPSAGPSSFFLSLGGGYANADGGAFERKRHFGSWRLWLTPIAAVGWSASEAKSAKGCQNQKWVKTPIPTIAGAIRCPVFETREMPTCCGRRRRGGRRR